MSGAFDHLESPLKEAPLFFCESPGAPPADPRKWPEAFRQRAFVAHLRKTSPAIIAASITNEGKRPVATGNRLRAQGLTAGMPDIVTLWQGGWAFLEFKGFAASGKPGKLSVQQIETCNRIHRQGHPVGCFFTADRALRWLKDHGAPVQGVA